MMHSPLNVKNVLTHINFFLSFFFSCAILHVLLILLAVYSSTLSPLFLCLHFALIAYLWNGC